MTGIPTFFFSHARQDRETGNYLEAFFNDLEKRLAQYAAVNLEEQRLGTIDKRVEQGENWDDRLSRGLRINNTFVMIITPLYFKRPNCGKELGVFLLRSSDLSIDQNGALTGVKNVMPIRWLPEEAYALNTVKDALIPPILRLINDTPADDDDDLERTEAIRRYRKKGMEKCVNVQPHYGELLDLLVTNILRMPELPPAVQASFVTAINAFTHDWAAHLKSTSNPATPSTPSAAPVAPRPLTSIVVFYITRQSFISDPNHVTFADQLIAEALPGTSVPTDTGFHALLADVRGAGVAEGLTVFHAAPDPVVPVSPETLLDRLASLSNEGVLTALVVDSTIWPGTTSDAETVTIEQIVHSSRWNGPVLLTPLDIGTSNIERLIASGVLPSRVSALPLVSAARVAVLRRVFVDERGRVLRTSTKQATDAERLPMLKGVGPEGK